MTQSSCNEASASCTAAEKSATVRGVRGIDLACPRVSRTVSWWSRKSNSASNPRSPECMSRVRSPRALTWYVVFHQWLINGVETS